MKDMKQTIYKIQHNVEDNIKSNSYQHIDDIVNNSKIVSEEIQNIDILNIVKDYCQSFIPENGYEMIYVLEQYVYLSPTYALDRTNDDEHKKCVVFNRDYERYIEQWNTVVFSFGHPCTWDMSRIGNHMMHLIHGDNFVKHTKIENIINQLALFINKEYYVLHYGYDEEQCFDPDDAEEMSSEDAMYVSNLHIIETTCYFDEFYKNIMHHFKDNTREVKAILKENRIEYYQNEYDLNEILNTTYQIIFED